MPARSSAPEIEARILDAATELFTAADYAGVTMPEVAARARIGLQTLYRHFQSKEALANAVFRKNKSIWAAATFANWPESAPPAEQFQTYWSRLCAYARKNRQVALYNERDPLGGEFDARSKALRNELDSRSTQVLSSWIASGEVKPLPGEVLKALIHGTFHRILELPVSKEKRTKLLQSAGAAIWDALARRD